MMEKEEQENKTMQPLSEAELEQVQGGLSSHRPALGPYDRECGNAAQGEILSCQICGEKVIAYCMAGHLNRVHGIKSKNP